MAYYRPDYDYIKGKELLEKLNIDDADLIRYYVSKKEERIEFLEKQLREMRQVFEGLSKYIK